MADEVSAESQGEGLPEEDGPIFSALPLIDTNTTRLKVNVCDLGVAEFRCPHAREEEQAEHQRVLDIVAPIQDLKESSEVFACKDLGESSPLLGGSQVAFPSDSLADVPPARVVQARLSDDPSDPSNDFGFRLSDLGLAIGRLFSVLRVFSHRFLLQDGFYFVIWLFSEVGITASDVGGGRPASPSRLPPALSQRRAGSSRHRPPAWPLH